MKKTRGALFILLLITLMFEPACLSARAEEGELLTLYVGESKVFPVNLPRRVIIGNPNIADITSITEDEVMITAKGPGSTSLIWWDKEGEQSFNLQVFSENMNETKMRIDNLLKELNLPAVSTRSVDSEGKVLLLGKVKTPQDLERIDTALGALKQKTINLIKVKEEEAVVEIDVQVLELNKDATQTLGFSWPASITLTEKGSPGIASTGTKWSTLFKVLNLNRAAFDWTLNALVQEGKARILSQPRLACQSGKEAELLVGGEKPILTTQVVSGGGTGTSVDYKEYGIKLKIKPAVTEEKRIKLALNVEVSEVETAVTIGGTTTTGLAYPLKKRNAATELYLDDGQTMVIGGLTKQKAEEDIRKTPFLGDVPILGLLFRKKETKAGGGQGERGNVELFITLTPAIIKEATAPSPAPEAPPLPPKEETIKAEAPSTIPEKEKISEETEPGVPPKADAFPQYAAAVAGQISDNFVYPWAALQAQIEGSLKLALHISSTGELLEVKVKEPSGFSILDENATKIAGQISPYPPFPKEITEDALWIEIPIVYNLKKTR